MEPEMLQTLIGQQVSVYSTQGLMADGTLHNASADAITLRNVRIYPAVEGRQRAYPIAEYERAVLPMRNVFVIAPWN